MNTYPMVCPRCGQGPDLHKVRVAGIDEPLFVCFECDATWLDENTIGQFGSTDFETYLRGRGVDPVTCEQVVIDSPEPPAVQASRPRSEPPM
jgi:hypothetical protein